MQFRKACVFLSGLRRAETRSTSGRVRTDNRLRETARVGATVVLTCVPQQHLCYVYPRSMFPGVHFETVLTGYVSDDLLKIEDVRPLAERPIVVGYRGRDLGSASRR